MNSILKSTTSLALCLSMIAPGMAFAQEAQPCGKSPTFPCKMGIGVVVDSQEALLKARLAHLKERRNEAKRTVQQLEADGAGEDALKDARGALARMEGQVDLTRNERDKAVAQAEADTAEQQAVQQRDSQAAEEERRARQEKRKARREAAAAAQAAGATEVQEEQLDREDVRASDQEFKKEGGGGLSKFEKALLLGLGAVAVGKILDNGDKVVSNSGDRVVVERDGELRVLKDDDALLRQPGSDVKTETFSDGSTRSTVTRQDGTKVVTIRAADGLVLRRSSFTSDGQEVVLFNDMVEETEVTVSELPQARPQRQASNVTSQDDLRAALAAEMATSGDRRFSLRQVREIQQVRALAPEIELDAVRFLTGSAAIAPEQARQLSRIGTTLATIIEQDPRTVFLVEGHTDAVGDATYNLSLSDRRAETVALALTEYFAVPPENLITQGYGEGALKILTLDAEPANRRAVVRNITGLLR